MPTVKTKLAPKTPSALKNTPVGKAMSKYKARKAAQAAAAEQSADAGTEAPLPTAIPANVEFTRANVLIDDLEAGPNARTFDDEEAHYIRTELLPSVQRHGVLTDPWVRRNPPGQSTSAYHIIAGERRWHAARLAGLLTIDVKIFDCSDAMAAELGLIENLQRRDLNPADRALGVARMVQEFGYVAYDDKQPERSAGHRLGFSKGKIIGILKIAQLPILGMQAVRSGELSESVAIRLARIPDPKMQVEAIEFAIRDRWSDKRAGDEIERNYMTELKGAPFDRKDISIHPEAGSCTACPKRTGNMMELFPDMAAGRADVCTDPGCYRTKCAKSFERRADEHTQKGGKVLSDSEAKKVGLEDRWSSIGGEWSTLDNRAHDVGDGDKTWREILKPALNSGDFLPSLALARDGSGKHFELATRDQLKEAAAALGVKVEKPTPAGSAEDKEKKVAAKRDKAIASHLLGVVANAGSRAFAGGVTGPMFEFFQAIALWLVDDRGNEAVKLVASRRELDVKSFRLGNDTVQDGARKALREFIGTHALGASLVGLVSELIAVPEFIPTEGNFTKTERIQPLLGYLGIDGDRVHHALLPSIPGGDKILERHAYIETLAPAILATLKDGPIDSHDIAEAADLKSPDVDAWLSWHGAASGVVRDGWKYRLATSEDQKGGQI